MASLLESLSPMADFQLSRSEPSSPMHSLFPDVVDVDPEVISPFDDLTEDLWSLMHSASNGSPDTGQYLSPSRSPADTETSESDINTDEATSLMYEILEYQNKFFEDPELPDSQLSSHSTEHLLLSDCMWGFSETTQSNQMEKFISPAGEQATPVPSTSPQASTKLPDENDATLSRDDCVEPAAVFPVLKATDPIPGIRVLPKPTSLKHTLGLSTSESEEEIDVVTVEMLDHKEEEEEQNPHHPHPHQPQHQQHQHHQRRNSQSYSNQSSPVSSPGRKKRHIKRLSRTSSQCSHLSNNDSDEEARRASHNVLERKRRNDLRNSFDMLRLQIPELEENARAPKVIILRKASEYIRSIQKKDIRIKDDLLKEQARQKKLLERLAYVRSLQAI